MPPAAPVSFNLVMFCQNVGSNANEPGKPQNVANFTVAPKGKDDIEEPNAGVLTGSQRGASLNLLGVSDEILDSLRGAPKVRVTIEVIS